MALYSTGVHVVCTDELTGIQALERKRLPMRPGAVERQEFEYIRHGTQCLMANVAVATGSIVAPSILDTRKEDDFLAHIQQTISTDPEVAFHCRPTQYAQIRISGALRGFTLRYRRRPWNQRQRGNLKINGDKGNFSC